MMTEARAVLVSADSEVPQEDFFFIKKLSEVPKGQESYIPARKAGFSHSLSSSSFSSICGQVPRARQ